MNDNDLELAMKESLISYYKEEKRNLIQEIIEKEETTIDDDIFKLGFFQLNAFQKDILYECIDKKTSGLSLPLGSGKTLISLVLGLYNTLINKASNPILIVVSKSLISNWETEIKKFFGENLKYEVVHGSILKNGMHLWKMKPDTKVVLITIDKLAKFYKSHSVDKKFIHQKYIRKDNIYINEYIEPTTPFLNHVVGGGLFYSIKWSFVIIDEVQKYTNIETLWCQCLGAICADYRWALSGTIFDEPSVKRILGYHIILNVPGKPRSLPTMTELVYHDNFAGLNETLISREKNNAFIPPKVNECIITHELSKEEEKIYTTMKKILIEIKKKAMRAKLYDNIEDLKKFNSYKLVMIGYLRQSLICPLIPITSISLNVCDMKNKSELSELVIQQLKNNGLNDWMDNVESAKSSRIVETIKCVNKHQNERVIIFCCFKSYFDILQYYLLELKKTIFVMTSNMNIKKRHDLLKNFEKSSNGILLITYQLGAEGLNLQFASTVLLIDFWWNASKTQQAIGRIFRFGQIADQINVYFFTSNTGIEKMLFQKQKAKLNILNELRVGSIKTKVPKINMDDVIRMIELEDNKTLLKKIKYY